MKRFKTILASILFLAVAVIPAFALAGCAKHYTVTISIAAGQGKVCKYNNNDVSLVGENDVIEGTDLEYVIQPQTHYEIDYVKIDGVVKEDLTTEEYSGISKLFLQNVNAHHAIEIGFKLRTYHITYEYWDDTENDYVKFVYQDKEYITDILAYTSKSIPGIADFGFLVKDENGQYVELSSKSEYIENNSLKIKKDVTLRAPANKGYDDLVALFHDIPNDNA